MVDHHRWSRRLRGWTRNMPSSTSSKFQIHSDQIALKIISGNHEPFSLGCSPTEAASGTTAPSPGQFRALVPPARGAQPLVMSNTREPKLKEGSPDEVP